MANSYSYATSVDVIKNSGKFGRRGVDTFNVNDKKFSDWYQVPENALEAQKFICFASMILIRAFVKPPRNFYEDIQFKV